MSSIEKLDIDTLNRTRFGTSCKFGNARQDTIRQKAAVLKKGAALFERLLISVDITNITVFGKPSDEVKQALSAFGAVFMAPIGGVTR